MLAKLDSLHKEYGFNTELLGDRYLTAQQAFDDLWGAAGLVRSGSDLKWVVNERSGKKQAYFDDDNPLAPRRTDNSTAPASDNVDTR